jgi:murein L,D-transpeptidase YafK
MKFLLPLLLMPGLLAALVWPVAGRADILIHDPALLAPVTPLADEVLVVKSERRLFLLREGEVLREFEVMLGQQPEGHKQREGDLRTPEGRYLLDFRNQDSDFFLSIRVSYPDENDRRLAAARGLDPGGQIMIHGLPNIRRYPEHYYLSQDWTEGCIAVSDADMIDIWLMTRANTPIEIRP